MVVDALIGDILKVDSRIRFVGIVDYGFHLLGSKQREGVQSLVPEEIDRSFVTLIPPIISDAMHKLQQYLGNVRVVTVRYEKMIDLLVCCKNCIVVSSVEPQTETSTLDKIAESIRRLVDQ